MSKEGARERHTQNLAAMCDGLGISLDQYFAMIQHDRYGYEFHLLIMGAIKHEQQLREYWDNLHKDDHGNGVDDEVLSLPLPSVIDL